MNRLLTHFAIPMMLVFSGFAFAYVPPPYQPPAAPKASEWPRERLVAFMNELIDFVYDHHVVKDPARPVFGMTYEFYRDGRQIQAFKLDAMHDGGWFMGACAVAQRACPEGDYLDRVNKYQVPFYTNALNHSDTLFPNMTPSVEDRKPLTAPVKGWLPRGWDDGLGYDKNTGKPFAPGYDTTSNHLLQDMADSLLNVWMSTRDPAVAEAIMNIQRYRHDTFGDIPPIANAAGIVSNQPALWGIYKFEPFDPARLKAGYPGLYQLKAVGIPPYNDDLAWAYRAAVSRYLATGTFPESFCLEAAAQVMGAITCMEDYHDDAPWLYGYTLFEIQKRPTFIEGQGKLDAYHSTSKFLYGARGTELAWIGAGVLPLLKRNPRLWEADYRQNHAKDFLVRIVDTPPELDCGPDAVYDLSPALGHDRDQIQMISDPKNLYLLIESPHTSFTLELAGVPPAPGKLVINITGENSQWSIDARNGRGEKLLFQSAFTPGVGPGGRFLCEFRIPYSVVPGQKPWLNGVDFGRYALKVNGASWCTIYMLSSPERVIARLEAHVLGTIQNWHEFWKAKGIIPSGTWGLGQPVHSWEMSDAGNVAHLVQTLALWLIYQDGKTEWELIKSRK